jgi:GMP synthase (glutamine-hydrolysing)
MEVKRLEYELPERLEDFDPFDFIEKATDFIRKNVKAKEKIAVSASGGVDSTTVLKLLSMQLNEEAIYPFFIDDGFRRIIRGEEEAEVVKKYLSKYSNFKVIDAKEKFFSTLKGLSNGEIKRKVFRDVYAQVSNEEISKIKADWIADGTIAPDIIETEGKVKTQHNVELPYKFKKLEILASLYKPHVRKVAKALELPDEIVYRIPCPGPAQLIRVVGEVNKEKLEIAKIATDIVEQKIEDYCKKIWGKEFKYNEKTGERIPFQMFGVALDNKMKKLSYFKGLNKMLNRTTYLEEGIKRPPEPLTMPVIWFETTTKSYLEWLKKRGKLTPYLFKISKNIWEDMGYPRVLYQVSGELRKDLPYLAAIRIVESKDATRAKPMEVEFEYLQKIGDEIRKKNPLVAAVAYDISTKPPATIEFE